MYPLPTYCNSHIIQSESSPILIPLAIHTVSVFPNHSQVLAGGLISWCLACGIRALSSSSFINRALSPLIGPSHSTVSLWPLTPGNLLLQSTGGSRSHLPPCPPLSCRAPHRVCQTLTEMWREDPDRRLMRERRGLDSDWQLHRGPSSSQR